MSKKGFTTTNIHSDRLDKPEHGVLHKAIHTSVAYGYDDARELAAVFQGKRSGYNYGRQLNPTVTALQNKITSMEQGIATAAFATGMAAIASSMLALLRAGDHLVSSAFLFGNTNSFFGTLQTLGIEVSFVDATDVKNVKAALQPNTRLVFVETIANPVTQIADIAAIGDLCRQHDLVYCVDNTMTSPHLFLPKAVSASLVVNSLTKYIGGHSDLLLGAVVTNRDDLAQALHQTQYAMGNAVSADDVWLALRGVKTLAIRLKQHTENALGICAYLDQHPKVSRLYFPPWHKDPGHALWQRDCSGGNGLLSLSLNASANDAKTFVNQLKLFGLGFLGEVLKAWCNGFHPVL